MKLLFVCTHNACRSILAECITRNLAGDRIEVASAGSEPAGKVHPLTLDYLGSIGLPTDGLRSKGFDELGDFQPEVVITVCDSAASESCPAWIGNAAVTAHWGLTDPSHVPGTGSEREAAFQSIQTILRTRIEGLLRYQFETMNATELRDLLRSLGSN